MHGLLKYDQVRSNRLGPHFTRLTASVVLQKRSIAGVHRLVRHGLQYVFVSLSSRSVVAIACYSIVRIEKTKLHTRPETKTNRAGPVGRSAGDVVGVKGAPYLVQKKLCHLIESRRYENVLFHGLYDDLPNRVTPYGLRLWSLRSSAARAEVTVFRTCA